MGKRPLLNRPFGIRRSQISNTNLDLVANLPFQLAHHIEGSLSRCPSRTRKTRGIFPHHRNLKRSRSLGLGVERTFGITIKMFQSSNCFLVEMVFSAACLSSDTTKSCRPSVSNDGTIPLKVGPIMSPGSNIRFPQQVLRMKSFPASASSSDATEVFRSGTAESYRWKQRGFIARTL